MAVRHSGSRDTMGQMVLLDAPAGSRPNRVYGKGRVCREEGCETILSRYNRATACFVHSADREYPCQRHITHKGWTDAQRERRKKEKEDARVAV